MDATQIAALERQMLEEHKKDLEALARLKRFLPNGTTHQAVDDRQLSLAVAVPTSSQDDDLDEAPVTSLRGKIEEIINADPNVRWTTQKVLSHLRQIGFPLKAQKPIYSVGQALQKMVDKGTIRVVRRGTGSTPNIYKGKITESTAQTEDHSGGDTIKTFMAG